MFKMVHQWIKTKLKKEDGMEMIQVLLISGIAIVLIITIFFPEMKKLFESVFGAITTWFTNHSSDVFK
ncbi:MAG: hypothetical protein ACM3KR_05895 [Deltaproteobacteria bacterium]